MAEDEDVSSRIRRLFDQAFSERYAWTPNEDTANDFSLKRHFERFGYREKFSSRLSTEESDKFRIKLAKRYLAVGDELSAAEVLYNGKLRNPSDYAWVLSNAARHGWFYNPAKQLSAYIKKFFYPSV